MHSWTHGLIDSWTNGLIMIYEESITILPRRKNEGHWPKAITQSGYRTAFESYFWQPIIDNADCLRFNAHSVYCTLMLHVPD